MRLVAGRRLRLFELGFASRRIGHDRGWSYSISELSGADTVTPKRRFDTSAEVTHRVVRRAGPRTDRYRLRDAAGQFVAELMLGYGKRQRHVDRFLAERIARGMCVATARRGFDQIAARSRSA